MYGKLKSWILDDVLFHSVLIILVGLIAFQLGRYSAVSNEHFSANTAAGVVLSEAGIIEEEQVQQGNAVVASRSGTKYHLPECPGAKQMKPENIIRFPSPEAAAAAGYEPAANCPGL